MLVDKLIFITFAKKYEHKKLILLLYFLLNKIKV
jgi:hypothetical protein